MLTRLFAIVVGLVIGCAGDQRPRHPERPARCTAADLRTDGKPWIAVVTVGPGPRLFEAFGHTLIALGEKRPVVFDYGRIPQREQSLSRFLTRRMGARLAVRNFARTMGRYRRQGRSVVVQRLALPPAAHRHLRRTLQREWESSDRDYRYHWYARNCTTRVRDRLHAASGSALRPQHTGPAATTHRDEVLRHFYGRQALAWLGWNYATGPSVDRRLSRWQAMFVPDRFRRGLARSRLTWPDGVARPVVARTCALSRGRYAPAPHHRPRRSGLLWGFGLAFGAAFLLLGYLAHGRRSLRMVFGGTVMLWGLVIGVAGVITTLLWATSDYQMFIASRNLAQANPASLLLLPAGLAIALGRARRFASVSTWILTGIAGAGALLDLGTGFRQDTVALTGLLLSPLVAITAAIHTLAYSERRDRNAPASLAPSPRDYSRAGLPGRQMDRP